MARSNQDIGLKEKPYCHLFLCVRDHSGVHRKKVVQNVRVERNKKETHVEREKKSRFKTRKGKEKRKEKSQPGRVTRKTTAVWEIKNRLFSVSFFAKV